MATKPFSSRGYAPFASLRPGPNVAASELHDALRDLTNALRSGQTVASALEGSPLHDAWAAALAQPDFLTDSKREHVVRLRHAALGDLDPVAGDWSRAMRPSHKRGPFLTEVGEQFWIDTFLLPRFINIVVQRSFGQARLLARIAILGTPVAGSRLRLGRGTMWLASNALAAGRPQNEFVGMRIAHGTALLAGPTQINNDTITLNGNWQFDLHLTLEHAADAGPVEGPGADAAAAVVNLPSEVTLAFSQTGLARLDLTASSLSAYGSNTHLTRSEDAPFYDELTRALVVPCASSVPEFAFDNVMSTLFGIHSSSKVARSGWALFVATIDPTQLGEADAAGFLWLDLTTPLPLTWRGLTREARSTRLVLGAAPAAITLWGTLNSRDVTQRLNLWDEPNTKPPRHSSIEVTSVAGSVVLHVSKPDTDAVVFGGELVAHLDKPLAADGGRVPVRMPIGWLGLTETDTGTVASVLATNPAALSSPHIAYALENALVKVRPPVWLGAHGPFGNDALDSGLLSLNAPYRFLLPTLPDPYTSNFDSSTQTDQDLGWLSASVTWATPQTPVLSFTLPPANTAAPPTFLETNNQDLVAVSSERLSFMIALVDVSSNADQMGVAFSARGAGYAQVSGLSLKLPASQAAVLTLPPISWEPMLTKTPEPGASDDIALPPPPHDGGPALVTADTVELQPVQPLPLLTAYHDAISLKCHFAARLPLPFGLIVHLDTRRVGHVGPTSTFKGTVFLNRPRFKTDLTGGLQLVFRSPDSMAGRDPTMPGYVEPCYDNDYALGVLSKNILQRLNGDFGHVSTNGVPLRRYELSGYGASLFSDWRDREAVGPAIIQARFDVVVGRTSYEVIQMQATLFPYSARVVRTITIERKTGGWVLREDSGWVPTSDGEFLFKGDPKAVGPPPPRVPAAFEPINVHKGAVKSVVNIRNIRMDGGQRDVPAKGEPGTITWQPVRFDADILFDTVADPRLALGAGANAQRVPSRGLTGWIQIDGPTYKSRADDGAEVDRARPANGAEVADLLALVGPARGPISCELLLGGTETEPGLRVQASSIDVSCALGPASTPLLVVAVRGSPALPRDGAWSLARLGASETEPHALDPSFPVPVVRPNLGQAGSNRWHLSDPVDILKLDDADAPSMGYGLVQSLGTQKVFFARPRVGNEAKPLTVPKPPQLADVGSLLNAAGIFPSFGEAFDFKALNALAVTKGDLGFSDTFEIGKTGALKSTVLADLGGADAIQLVIEYHDEKDQPTVATISVNPTDSPRWSISLERVAFTVRYRKNALISLFARVKADEHTAPTIQALNIRYENILQCLQSIFTNVQQVANFLPGGAGAKLKVGFSQGHLTIRNDFALPNLPLGAGQITDVAVVMALEVALTPFDVRFVAGLGSTDKPFRWIVSPLAGTGVVQVGIGRKGLDVLVQGGLGLGLAIDLGIASGAASITLALEINTGPDPFEIKGILSGRASVDVLRGLASATITLAAGLGIIPPKELFEKPYLPPSVPPQSPIGPFTIGLTASVKVGIHLTVCWVVDVDFDAYWQFRQDIKTPAIPIPLL